MKKDMYEEEERVIDERTYECRMLRKSENNIFSTLRPVRQTASIAVKSCC